MGKCSRERITTPRTDRKIMDEENLIGRQSIKKTSFTEAMKKKCLQWARRHPKLLVHQKTLYTKVVRNSIPYQGANTPE